MLPRSQNVQREFVEILINRPVVVVQGSYSTSPGCYEGKLNAHLAYAITSRWTSQCFIVLREVSYQFLDFRAWLPWVVSEPEASIGAHATVGTFTDCATTCPRSEIWDNNYNTSGQLGGAGSLVRTVVGLSSSSCTAMRFRAVDSIYPYVLVLGRFTKRCDF